jgi:hypothetical protein
MMRIRPVISVVALILLFPTFVALYRFGPFSVYYHVFGHWYDCPARLYGLETMKPFRYSTTKPIFYQLKGKLYYSQDGTISRNSRPIFTKKLRGAFVSPNSKLLLLLSNAGSGNAHVLDDTGRILHTLKYVKEEHEKMGSYWGGKRKAAFLWSTVQWSSDSTFFVIAKRAKTQTETKHIVYKVDIASGTRTRVSDPNSRLFSMYLSRKRKHIYYHHSCAGNLCWSRCPITFGKPCQRISFDSSTVAKLFLHFQPQKFEQNGHNFTSKSHDLCKTVKAGPTVGIVYRSCHSNKKRTLIRERTAYEALSGRYSSSLDFGLFLPGNRFFLGTFRAENFQGQLLFDVKNGAYMKMPSSFVPYFSVTSDDCVGCFIDDDRVYKMKRKTNQQ